MQKLTQAIAVVFVAAVAVFLGCGTGGNSANIAHDLSTPEGAILCLEDAYRAEDIEAAVKCKDFGVEAKMMLEKIQTDFAVDEEILSQTAEVLELAFRKEMQGGFPKMEGIESSFPKKTPHNGSDDIMAVTEVCTYPDGGKSTQQILVAKTESGWKVLIPTD